MTDENRDDPTDDSLGDWARTALAGVLERCRREQAAAEEHVRTCTDRPCDRCGRYVCRSCGAPVDGAKACAACDAAEYLARLLRPTRESVPPHFRWALDTTVEALRSRVQGSAEMLRRALDGPPSTSLLLLGNTGAGKTSLAVAMLGAWVRREPGKRTGALFVEAARLSRARARHRLGEEAPEVTAALACPLLVLDDLGAEREDRDGCITDVIYGRSNAELPTWVTCGLQPKVTVASAEDAMRELAALLAARYDGGFVRRIFENGKRVMLGANGQR